MHANISIRLPADKIEKIKAKAGNRAFSGIIEAALKAYLASVDSDQIVKGSRAQAQTSICLDVVLAQKLKEVADAAGVPTSTLIRLAVEKAEQDGVI